MKVWTFAAFVTSLVVVSMALRKSLEKLPVIARDQDKRYTTDDFLDSLD